MSQLDGKVVIVTGASSGIGEAAAKHLSKNGAKLVLAARREERLETLKKAIEDEGGQAIYKVTDVTSREQVQALADEALETYGKIDAIVNNAGLMPLSLMDKLKVDEWDRMVDVNIKGVLYGIAAVLPHMKEQKSGHIVNVSSVAGHEVMKGSAVYSGTKFAVRAITEGLRKEVSADNIRTTIISPGAVATELTNTITDKDIIDAFSSRFAEMERLQGEDIAKAVVYALEQPEHVAINEVLVRPTQQP